MPKAPAWMTKLPRPALMAIGDSLINGMRAYSVTDQMAKTSTPARLGASLRQSDGFAPFRPADYPEPLLFDLEALAAQARLLKPLLTVLLDQLDDIHDNAVRWVTQAHGPAAAPAFDNLGLSGAVIADVFDVTLGEQHDRLAAMRPVIEKTSLLTRWKGALPDGTAWGLGDVHLALNQRHLMDPAGLGGLDGFTMLDIVAARKPRVLMVGLGPNHGLITITAAGAHDAGLDGLRAYAADWPRCAKRLAKLDGVEVVIIGLMPRPSQVPNLMPYNREHEGWAEDMPETPGAYYPHYVSALSVPPLGFGASYTGSLVKHLDDEVEAVRQSVIKSSRAAFKGSGKTLLFMDYAEIIGAHDHKHLRGKLFGPKPGLLRQGYCNRPLGDLGRFAGRNLRGGICSLDNHHPTAMAYAHIAETVRLSLPPEIASKPIRVSDEDDPTLTDPPSWAIGFLQTLRPIAPDDMATGAVAQAGAENNFCDVFLGRGQLRV